MCTTMVNRRVHLVTACSWVTLIWVTTLAELRTPDTRFYGVPHALTYAIFTPRRKILALVSRWCRNEVNYISLSTAFLQFVIKIVLSLHLFPSLCGLEMRFNCIPLPVVFLSVDILLLFAIKIPLLSHLFFSFLGGGLEMRLTIYLHPFPSRVWTFFLYIYLSLKSFFSHTFFLSLIHSV